MEIYDLMNLKSEGYEKRAGSAFFQNDRFKVRVIELNPGQSIPKCQMECFVMFYVVHGEVSLTRNEETSVLKQNQMIISEPAVFSMETNVGARLMGVQIKVDP